MSTTTFVFQVSTHKKFFPMGIEKVFFAARGAHTWRRRRHQNADSGFALAIAACYPHSRTDLNSR